MRCLSFPGASPILPRRFQLCLGVASRLQPEDQDLRVRFQKASLGLCPLLAPLLRLRDCWRDLFWSESLC